MLFTGELLHQSARALEDGSHPRVMVEGFEKARDATIEFLDEFKVELKGDIDRETMMQIARTSIRTKVRSHQHIQRTHGGGHAHTHTHTLLRCTSSLPTT